MVEDYRLKELERKVEKLEEATSELPKLGGDVANALDEVRSFRRVIIGAAVSIISAIVLHQFIDIVFR